MEETAKIHGEAEISFRIGNTRIIYQATICDIENEVIVIGTNVFQLDLKRGVVQVNEEEVILYLNKMY